MGIVKANESLPKRATITLIYGSPGAGKTSLASTANNALLIDADRGADRAIRRPDTLVANNWQEIIDERETIKSYGTVVMDTAKAVLDDFLMLWVTERDATLKRNKLKAYGAIGDEFKSFTAELRANNQDIVVLAHAKSEKDGDNWITYPDVTGGSKDLLLRIADQVGYLSIVNGKRTIQWEPTEKSIGKNVAHLPITIIPDEGDAAFDDFLAGIVNGIKESLQRRSAVQAEAVSIIEQMREQIDMICEPQHATAMLAEIEKLPKTRQIVLKKVLNAKTKELGYTYDPANKNFVERTK